MHSAQGAQETAVLLLANSLEWCWNIGQSVKFGMVCWPVHLSLPICLAAGHSQPYTGKEQISKEVLPVKPQRQGHQHESADPEKTLHTDYGPQETNEEPQAASTASPPAAPSEEKTLVHDVQTKKLGRFTLLKELGQGGMGAVFSKFKFTLARLRCTGVSPTCRPK